MFATRMIVALAIIALGGCASTQPAHEQAATALAPSGPLRVAFLAGPLYATKDPATGELRGVAIELSQGLSTRLGTTMQPVAYTSPAAIMASARTGEWDLALMGVNPERAAVFDFSPPYMEVEQGYLARAGLAVSTVSDVDQRGIRVGVVENTGADMLLSRTLANATLVRVKSLQDLERALADGRADVIAATKTFLFGRAVNLPGARMLDGRILVEPIAVAVPKDKDRAALAAVTRFVEEAKRSGLVAGAISRAGLQGVAVAP